MVYTHEDFVKELNEHYEAVRPTWEARVAAHKRNRAKKEAKRLEAQQEAEMNHAKQQLNTSKDEPLSATSIIAETQTEPMDVGCATRQASASGGTAIGNVDGTLFVSRTANGAKEYAPPEWYNNMTKHRFQMMRLKTNKKDTSASQALTALSALKQCVSRCEKETNPAALARLFDELRDHVHKAEFIDVTRLIVRKANMLDQNGLSKIFASKADVDYPFDLKADALQLYLRWSNEVFSVDLLRGIMESKNTDKSNKRNADRIHPNWPKFPAKYYGEGDLVIGQWWPTQLCTVRDGAHGSTQGGIYGEKGKGAYSIVLSGGQHYTDIDIDKGDTIWYSGTESTTNEPTEVTQRMLETSTRIKNPVRVIRSHQLSKDNPYRPVRGLRYDGLYEIVGHRCLDESKAIYNFHLIRRPGQPPIRYEDNPARRPTKYEIAAFDKLRKEGRGFEFDDR